MTNNANRFSSAKLWTFTSRYLFSSQKNIQPGKFVFLCKSSRILCHCFTYQIV